jgi:hypothetical protein
VFYLLRVETEFDDVKNGDSVWNLSGMARKAFKYGVEESIYNHQVVSSSLTAGSI